MWFEVLGQDSEKLRKFYGGLFGWTFTNDSPYGIVDTGAGRGIAGGVGPVYPGTRAWVTFYVETSDVAASLKQAEQLGGRTVLPRTAMPDVTLAVFEDPEGHAIGLVEAKPA